MKFIILALSLMFTLSALASNGSSEMASLIKIQKSTSLYSEAREQGYDIQEVRRPKIKKEYKEFRTFLRENEEEQQLLFNEVVDAGEYGFRNREEIKREARKFLEVNFLFEIYSTFKVTKDGKFIGYIFAIYEHGQAAVYQDGAWSDVYVNKDFEIVYRDQQSA